MARLVGLVGVEGIDLRYTRLRKEDGREVLVPNAVLFKKEIEVIERR